ncbi:MAG TPA: serine protease [Hyphomonadaceae bacterium]|nr:serine protease [Hyphomonadaceae bacterium]
MRVPDWLIYAAALALIFWGVTNRFERRDAPEPLPPDIAAPRPSESGPLLPPPTQFDPTIEVEVGPPGPSIGTAFAIAEDGVWLTARHVVDGCARVGLAVGPTTLLPVRSVTISPIADVAMLRTQRAPDAIALSLVDDLRVSQPGFHVGFPQGQPGEATSTLLGRERLIARGRYALDEPVIAWAERGRTRGLSGTLGGMSGGPVLDRYGNVIGITIAESSRRGRIYTSSPSTIARFLRESGEFADGAPIGQIGVEDYWYAANELRNRFVVAKVVCVTR